MHMGRLELRQGAKRSKRKNFRTWKSNCQKQRDTICPISRAPNFHRKDQTNVKTGWGAGGVEPVSTEEAAQGAQQETRQRREFLQAQCRGHGADTGTLRAEGTAESPRAHKAGPRRLQGDARRQPRGGTGTNMPHDVAAESRKAND